VDTATNNRLAFFRWLRATSPQLYGAMLPEIQADPKQMAGIFDFLSSVGTSISNAVSKAADIIPSLAQTYVQTKQQVDLIKVNLQRARTGQAPVTSLPEESSNDSATSESPGFFASIPPWGWAAIALGGIFVFTQLRGRR
jgi:hypothetical protein